MAYSSSTKDTLFNSFNDYELFNAFISLLLDQSQGFLSKTVFGRPKNAYAYDVLASSQASIMNAAMKGYGSSMTRSSEEARISALAEFSGLGNAAKFALSAPFQLYMRDIGQAAIGHFGGDKAVSALLSFAKPMAKARGNLPGGLLDQRKLQENLKAAAIEGGAVYNTFFSPDGSINLDQTKGLSLAAAGNIAANVLSDRSLREGWARAVMKNSTGPDSFEGGLTKKDIDNLKSGKAWSEEALKSFGDYTRKFTAELNSFVASVSKITGSYDEAITFLQRLTGGDLFKDTDRAKKSREKASTIATHMRIAAADAGISVQELYSVSDKYRVASGLARGLGADEIARGGADVTTQLSSLASIAVARARAKDPQASQEKISRIELAVGDALRGYVGSEQDKMNALAARLKGNNVDMSGYETYLREGNTTKAKEFLISKYGYLNFIDYMHSDGLVWLDSKQYNDEYTRYASLSLSNGRNRDVTRIGKERRLNKTFTDLSNMLSGGDADKASRLRVGLLEKHRENLLSDAALQAAGIDGEEQRKAIRAWGRGRSIYEINQYLDKLYGADTSDEVRRVATRMTKDYVKTVSHENIMTKEEESRVLESIRNASKEELNLTEEQRTEFIKKAAGKSLRQVIDLLSSYLIDDPDKAASVVRKFTGGKIEADNAGMVDAAASIFDSLAPEITEEDKKQARSRILYDKKRSELRKMFEDAYSGDLTAYARLTSFGSNSMLESALTGDTYKLAGEPYLRNLISEAYGIDGSNLPEERKRKALDAALAAHGSAVADSKSPEETAAVLEDTLTRNGIDVSGKRGFDVDVKRRAFTRTLVEESLKSLTGEVTENLGTSISKESAVLDLPQEVRQKIIQDITASGDAVDEEILAALKKSYSEHYQNLVKEGKISEDEAKKLSDVVSGVLGGDIGKKSVARSKISAANRALYISEEGIVRDAAGALAIPELEAIKRAASDKTTAEDAATNQGYAADPRNTSNVVNLFYDGNLVTPDLFTPLDETAASFTARADSKSVEESARQLTTPQNRALIEQAKKSIADSGNDRALVSLEQRLADRFGTGYMSALAERKDEIIAAITEDAEGKKLLSSQFSGAKSEERLLSAVQSIAVARQEGQSSDDAVRKVAMAALVLDKTQPFTSQLDETAAMNVPTGDSRGTKPVDTTTANTSTHPASVSSNQVSSVNISSFETLPERISSSLAPIVEKLATSLDGFRNAIDSKSAMAKSDNPSSLEKESVLADQNETREFRSNVVRSLGSIVNALRSTC